MCAKNTGDKIISFISENFTNPNLTLRDLQIEFGIDKKELSSLINRTSKMSLPKLLNDLRIKEARKILSSKSDLTISEIGYQVGYNSPSNFVRVFKSIEGITPNKFRQTQG